MIGPFRADRHFVWSLDARTATVTRQRPLTANCQEEMPLRAIGWSHIDDTILVQAVKPHEVLYKVKVLTRKIILDRQSKWQEISNVVGKPVAECKKRWRGIRNSYIRNKRLGSRYRGKVFDEMAFLDGSPEDCMDQETVYVVEETASGDKTNQIAVDKFESEEEVITDNREYYDMSVVDIPQDQNTTQQYIKIVPHLEPKPQNEEIKKNGMKNAGRRKRVSIPRNYPPVKILPKPIISAPKLLGYAVDEQNSNETRSHFMQTQLKQKSQQFIQKAAGQGPQLVEQVTPEQRSQSIDKLIEKILKESTNEIDVFFKSMAASVKKLQPNLIPKVKMEVCNVIAKYEMQSYENK